MSQRKKHPLNIDCSPFHCTKLPKQKERKKGEITRSEKLTEHEHALNVLAKAKRINKPVKVLVKDRNGNESIQMIY